MCYLKEMAGILCLSYVALYARLILKYEEAISTAPLTKYFFFPPLQTGLSDDFWRPSPGLVRVLGRVVLYEILLSLGEGGVC